MTGQRRIIALAGLSGSGKSTLLRALDGKMPFTHLSASALLRKKTARAGKPQDSEALRRGDIDDNQHLLVEAFNETTREIAGDIIFDCHTLIDTPTGLQFIPPAVFRAIGITDIGFLSVDPQELTARREQDAGRPRPSRTAEELAEHQALAIAAARKIADTIGATFTDIGIAPEEKLVLLLSAGCSQIRGDA